MKPVVFNASNLKVGQGDFSVSNIDFSLINGSIIGLVGKSGCGKSTLLKTIIGEQRPLQGIIKLQVDKEDVKIINNIAYSPQENALFSHLTLKENIDLFGKLYGVSSKIIEKRKEEILSKLQLNSQENKLIKNFSGGMKKRADLAVSLIHDPPIIILDEPFNGLDVAIQEFIWTLLVDLAKEGKIILVSSHYLEDMEKHCNNIFIIHENTFSNFIDIKKRFGTNESLSTTLKKLIKEEYK